MAAHLIVEGEPGSTPWPVWRVMEGVFGPLRRWLERGRRGDGDEPPADRRPGPDGG